jgi:hypothetical protein
MKIDELPMMSLRPTTYGALIVAILAVMPARAQLRFETMNRDIVEQRLKSYKGTDNQREATLKGMFQQAGCTGENLSEQAAKGLKQPNIICELPGTTDSVIVVGAHYDHVDRGDGVVDNWSGASMLPSLYQALKDTPHQYTFRFISFAGEEQGLVGSKFYAKNLPPEQMKKIKVMVCMDTLALGPTEVWVSHSNLDLVRALYRIALSLKLPLARMDVEKVGSSDEESFIQHKVPTITIHSLTQATLSVLHSPQDNYTAVHFDDYYQSYRLICAYLALLDQEEVNAISTPSGTAVAH